MPEDEAKFTKVTYTIIHIPSVNSAESSKEKYEEVNHIIDVLRVLEYQDETTAKVISRT